MWSKNVLFLRRHILWGASCHSYALSHSYSAGYNAGMCGRFTLRTKMNVLLQEFAIEAQPTFPQFERFNIPPTVKIPVVRQAEGQRTLSLIRWGLIPSWAKDLKKVPLNNNARAETIAEKPMFRSAYKRRRCIIPASSFFEWLTEGKVKTPFVFKRPDDVPLAFAGIWETWKDNETSEDVDSCAIVTCDANAVMAPVHERMPVILGRNDYSEWLDPAVESPAHLMAPCPDDELTCYQVSTIVNNSRNEGPECIVPMNSE
jgi:putative SOS response-associated peptidase YedK